MQILENLGFRCPMVTELVTMKVHRFFLEFEFSPSDGGSTPVPSAPQALEVKK